MYRNVQAGPSRPPQNTMTGPKLDSMSSLLHAPLTDLTALSQTLFQSLAPPQSKPPPPPPISAFIECDYALARAVQMARTHQAKQRRIEELKREVMGLDERWREIVEELETGRRDLEGLIAEGEERIKGIEQAKNGSPIFILSNYALHCWKA